MTRSSILRDVQCGFCLSLVQSPVCLPCGHLYCSHNCVSQLTRGQQVLCLVCHTSFKLKPHDFKTNQLFGDFLVHLEKTTSGKGCNQHSGMSLDYYCPQCQQELCMTCWKLHPNHEVQLLEVFWQREFTKKLKHFDPHRRLNNTKAKLSQVDFQIQELSTLMDKMKEYSNNLAEEREKITELKREVLKFKKLNKDEDFDFAEHERQLEKFAEFVQQNLNEIQVKRSAVDLNSYLTRLRSQKGHIPRDGHGSDATLPQKDDTHSGAKLNNDVRCQPKTADINESFFNSSASSAPDQLATLVKYLLECQRKTQPKMTQLGKRFSEGNTDEESNETSAAVVTAQTMSQKVKAPPSSLESKGNLATETETQEVKSKTSGGLTKNIQTKRTSISSSSCMSLQYSLIDRSRAINEVETTGSTNSSGKQQESTIKNIVSSVGTSEQTSMAIYGILESHQVFNNSTIGKDYDSLTENNTMTMTSFYQEYAVMPAKTEVIQPVNAGDRAQFKEGKGLKLLVAAFWPETSTLFQLKSQKLRKILWSDDPTDSYNGSNLAELDYAQVENQMGGPHSITSAVFKPQNLDSTHPEELMVYISGRNPDSKNRNTLSVWLFSGVSLQLKTEIVLKKPRGCDKFDNLLLAAEKDVLVLHIVGTNYFFFFKQLQKIGKLKARVPSKVSAIELKGKLLFAGSSEDNSVSAYEIIWQQGFRKPKLVSKSPVWGPIPAFCGAFALPNDSCDIITCSPHAPNKLMLFNTRLKEREPSDSYECAFHFATVAPIQGGALQGRDKNDKLILLKLKG